MNVKIMTISDSPRLFSGMARVHRNAIDALVDAGHEVLPCCWFAYTTKEMARFNKGEQPTPLFYETPKGNKVRYYAVPKSGGNKPMLTIYDAAELFKPDVVLTMGDVWDFWYMGPIKSKLDFGFKWVAYVNVESNPSSQHAAVLKYADLVMVPSQYGACVLARHGISSKVSPYGVSDCFRRKSDSERAALRADRGIEDQVRFICVAQNTTRKNIPALFWAAKSIASMGDFKVHLHTNIGATDPLEAFSYNLREVEKAIGVTGLISYPTSGSLFDSPSDEALAEEYNASDFLLMPSLAEGFALPVVEAMACGVPVLVNDTSAMTEHVMDGLTVDGGDVEGWHERGYLCAYRLQVFPPAIMGRVIDTDSMARGMAEAMHNRRSSWMEGKRRSCEEYAKGLTWEGAKNRLCDAVEAMAGPAVVPVEEL